MKKIYTLLVIAVFMMVSCSDNSGAPIEESVDLVQTTTETNSADGSVLTTTYTYEGDKVVTTQLSDGTTGFWYYNDDLLTLIKYYDGTELKTEDVFEYSDSLLATHYKRQIIDNYVDKTTYTHNDDGTISTANFSGDLVDQTTEGGTGVITISNGNIIQYAFTLNGTTTVNNFTFDDKNSPFKNRFGQDVLNMIVPAGGVNNILSSFEGNNSYTLSHTYNEDDYPTQTVYLDAQGNTTKTIDYIYYDK